jgi:heme o synthase
MPMQKTRFRTKAIVLVWTPPHFWALALLLAPRYAAAKVPMLPVVQE